MTQGKAFELDLGPGITVLQASAGTGKTRTLTDLVLRLAVEREIPLGKILVVTFTRAATAELQDRLGSRLETAARILAGGATPAPDPDPELADWLRTLAASRAPGRIRNLVEAARRDLDAASISTLHGFCQQVLRTYGFATGVGLGSRLLADLGELVEEAVDDWLASTRTPASPAMVRFLEGPCLADRASLLRLAREVAQDPRRRVDPDPVAAEAALSRFAADLAAFTASWIAEGDEACRRLAEAMAQKQLDGKSYQQRYLDGHRPKLERWLARPSSFETKDGETTGFGAFFSAARQLAKAKKGFPAGGLHPLFVRWDALAAAFETTQGAERARFARWVGGALEAAKRRSDALGYQDLLQLTADAVAASDDLVDRLGRDYQACLVDEFQDTDPLQWRILERVFATPGHRLFLVGDPKQAIYSFRGADVEVYLEAAKLADRRTSLDRNWRSDAALLDGLEGLLHRPGIFGVEKIDFESVRPGRPESAGSVLRTGPDARPGDLAPVSVRFLDSRVRTGRHKTHAAAAEAPLAPPGGAAQAQPVASEPLAGELQTHGTEPESLGDAWSELPRLAHRVAADVADALERGPRLERSGVTRLPSPEDVAVLVATNREARLVQDALRELGIPAVIGNTGTLYSTPEADDLRRLLAALERPADRTRALWAAASPAFGWTEADLVTARESRDEDPALAAWVDRLAQGHTLAERQGVVTAFRFLAAATGLADRLLALPAGERRLVNWLHGVELLGEEEHQRGKGIARLHRWLAEKVVEAEEGSEPAPDDPALVRLETDGSAVRVVTVHKAKGLEFPLVFVPAFLGKVRVRNSSHAALVVRDPDRPGERLLHVDPRQDAPGKAGFLASAEAALRAESMRLLYVALTRARHRLVLYWGALAGAETSPLAALFHGGERGPGEPPDAVLVRGAERYPELDPKAILSEVEAFLHRLGPLAHVEVAGRVATTRAGKAAGAAPAGLEVRRFGGTAPDRGWGRTSYSALASRVAPVDGVVPGEDPQRPGADGGEDARGETAEDPAGPAGEDSGAGTGTGPDPGPVRGLPLETWPGGTAAGSALHEAIEGIDFAALASPSAEDPELPGILARAARRQGIELPDPKAAALGFRTVLATPLGGPLGSFRLVDLARTDRVDEFAFELPVAGGSRARVSAAASHLVEALRLRAGDGVIGASWLDRLAEGFADRDALAGFLVGSIDLVFRVASGTGSTWYLADWKSNRLPRRGPVASAADYARPRLLSAMEHHHYHLQSHLYALALHRYLGLRLGPDYDYQRDFGGLCYLFVRGMDGTPGAGVFHDRPPLEVIEALDHALQGPGGGPP